MAQSDSSDSYQQPRAGLGSTTPNPVTTSRVNPPSHLLNSSDDEAAAHNSSSDEEALGDIAGLPSAFGGSRSRKRRRVSKPSRTTHHAPVINSVAAGAGPAGEWERHTRGIASKLMAKYGFKGRLGKHGDGIAAPIEVKLRANKAGLGADETVDKAPREQVAAERKAAVPAPDWNIDATVGGRGAVTTTRKLSVVPDVPREVKVIDMRSASAQRTASDGWVSNDANREQSADGFVQPDILFHLRLLQDAARANIAGHKQRMDTEKLIVDSTRSELARIDEEKRLIQTEFEDASKLKAALQKVKTLTADTSDSSWQQWFEHFAKTVKHTAPIHASDRYYARAALNEILTRHVDGKFGDMVSKSRQHRRESLCIAQHIERCLAATKGALTEEVYIRMCSRVILGRLRRHIGSGEWQAVSGAGLADILYKLKTVVPHVVMITLGEEIIAPKLSRQLDSTSDKNEVPMHVWIHPWLPVVGRRSLTEVLGRVRMQVSKSLQAWDVKDSDESALQLVQTWDGVLSRRKMQVVLARHILPKLVGGLVEYSGRGDLDGCASTPSIFIALEHWCSVMSSQIVSRGVQEVFHGMCARLQRCALGRERADWERGCDWYRTWKEWMPRKLDDKLSGAYAALLFVLHAGRVVNDAPMRLRLAHADCRVLFDNAFARP